MGEKLFKSRPKNILMIVSSGLYILSILLEINLPTGIFSGLGVATFRYLINTVVITFFDVAPPLALLLAAVTSGKNKVLRKYIVPVGFGIRCVSALSLAFGSTELLLSGGYHGPILYVLVCLQGIAVILMFIGTLYDFEPIGLLKAGSALFFGAVTVTTVYRMIFTGYLLYNNVDDVFQVLTLLFFHAALFAATKNCARDKAASEPAARAEETNEVEEAEEADEDR